MKRELVELEREISLTTPLIAELDSQLTGNAGTAEQMRNPSSPAAEPTSSAKPTVKTTEAEISSSSTAETVVTAVDSGLQMESLTTSSRSLQVCCFNAVHLLTYLLSYENVIIVTHYQIFLENYIIY